VRADVERRTVVIDIEALRDPRAYTSADGIRPSKPRAFVDRSDGMATGRPDGVSAYRFPVRPSI
jgi:hypothetical protein